MTARTAAPTAAPAAATPTAALAAAAPTAAPAADVGEGERNKVLTAARTGGGGFLFALGDLHADPPALGRESFDTGERDRGDPVAARRL